MVKKKFVVELLRSYANALEEEDGEVNGLLGENLGIVTARTSGGQLFAVAVIRHDNMDALGEAIDKIRTGCGAKE